MGDILTLLTYILIGIGFGLANYAKMKGNLSIKISGSLITAAIWPLALGLIVGMKLFSEELFSVTREGRRDG